MAITKTINDVENGGVYDTISVPGIVYDTKPVEGSFNGVTSDAVAKIAGGVADLDAIVPEGASEENKLATAADVAGVQSNVDTVNGKIPSDTSTANKLVNESGLQDAIDNASESWSTGFTPKGESSVSDLNDLATQSNGDSYIVTDSGTLTDGSLAVVGGDQVAWDATNSMWYKLPQYALRSAVDNISDSIAEEFVPNSTTTIADQLYMYNDSLYNAKVDGYQGPWDGSKFVKVDVGSKLVKKSQINLFDKTTVTADRYLYNGIPSYLSGYFTSDWIEVKAGARLKFVHGFITALYDETKTFVKNFTGMDILIPDGVAYIRTCDKNEFLDSMQIGYNISYSDYKSHNEEQVDDFIDVSKVLNVPSVATDSLINFTNALDGKYLKDDGTEGGNSQFILTSYVPVKEGYFSSKYLFNYGLYDENMTLTRVVASPNTVITASEKYVRITINKDNLHIIQANLGIGTPTLKINDAAHFSESGNPSLSYESYDVAVGPSGCNFTTISAALAAITDASPKKRYRIIVAEGTYEETFTTKDYVDIIGKNRYKCVVNYTNADEEHYANYSTIFATSNTTLENLTITTQGAKYPVHSDGAYNRDYRLVIKDCTLIHNGFVGGNTAGTALGIGLYHGQHIEVINCHLKAGGTLGASACYCHNSTAANENQAGFRSLKLDGVILEGGSYGLRLQSLGTNASFAQKDECVLKNVVSFADVKDIYYEPNSLDEWTIENFTGLAIEN